jgi:hypothetical protein
MPVVFVAPSLTSPIGRRCAEVAAVVSGGHQRRLSPSSSHQNSGATEAAMAAARLSRRWDLSERKADSQPPPLPWHMRSVPARLT